MMNICSTCQGAQSECQERLDANAEYRDARQRDAAPATACDYEGGLVNKNFLWVLVEEIGLDELKSLVKRPLTDLKVGPFYGCYIVRPTDRLGIDAEQPARHVPRAGHRGARRHRHRLRRLAQVLRLPDHHDEQGGLAASRPAATSATRIDADADCLVTPCPLCHLNLDLQQPLAEQAVGRELKMPVLHLPQLVGLALGLAPKELGLQHHVVKPTSVIDWTKSVVAGVGA